MKRYIPMILLMVLIISLSLPFVQSQPCVMDPVQVQTDVFSNGTTAVIRLVIYPYTILNGPLEDWDDYLARIEFEPDLVRSTLYLLNSSGFYYLNETIFPAGVQVVNATFSRDWYLWGRDTIHGILYAYRVNTNKMCAVRVSDVPESGNLLPVLSPTIKNGSVEFSGGGFSFLIPKDLLDRYVLDWIQPYLRAVPVRNGYLIYLPGWSLMGFNGTFVFTASSGNPNEFGNRTIPYEKVPPIVIYYSGSNLTPLAVSVPEVPSRGIEPKSVHIGFCHRGSWERFLPKIPTSESEDAVIASNIFIGFFSSKGGSYVEVTEDRFVNPYPPSPRPTLKEYLSGLVYNTTVDRYYRIEGNNLVRVEWVEPGKMQGVYWFDDFLNNGSVAFIEPRPNPRRLYLPLKTLLKFAPNRELVKYLYVIPLNDGFIVYYCCPRVVFFNGTYYFSPHFSGDYTMTLRELPPLIGYISKNGTVYTYPLLQPRLDEKGWLYYVFMRGRAPIRPVEEAPSNVSTTTGSTTTATSEQVNEKLCGPAFIVLLTVLPLLRKRL
ncbi:conserved exported protein of unknown function [Thermococcus nautili]|uniref:CGP-CTERM sorting domain-containing protein n=1 Tax=Thermococcus nautili TaxID=195522 RepID=UPI0025543956|nr:CGP-CTERM sorting domain-containing protein [Thermococcus nautili]CAI1493240.1 conserved exported protein of unknown function [Thermococcus nautili]